jgi:hypothetical protein
MGMTDFFLVFPNLADNELRNITVGSGSSLGLPAGRYAFAESYCDEKGCDCRRVLIRVYSERSGDYIAHINMGFDSADPMAGPFLDPLDYQGPQATALMGFFTDMVNSDPAYLARLHRHYVQFKERLEGRRYKGPPFEEPNKIRRVAAAQPPGRPFPGGLEMGSPALPVRREAKIRRNDPCPCGSGKKYKHCCMGKAQAVSNLPSAEPQPQTTESPQPHLALANDPVLRSQIEHLVAAIVLGRQQPAGKGARWAPAVQEALESVHPVAFHLLDLLLGRYAPDGRQHTPPPEYAACLELLGETLTQIRYSVERRRPVAIAMATDIQRQIAERAFKPEVDVRVQQDLIMALHESKLELHPSIRDKAAEIAGYYARFGARKGSQSLDQVLERLVQQTQPRDAFDLIEPMLAEMALLPVDAVIGLAAALMASSQPVLNELAVPMLLYPDRQVRATLPDLYRGPASLARLSPLGLRRLIGLRNWLPADERPGIDALIEASRRAGTQSASLPQTKPIGAHASAIDGSGAQALWLSVKDRKRYRLEGVLVRQHEGVRETFSKTDLTKRELDSGIGQMADDLVAIPVRLDYVQRMIGHCIAVGINGGTVPPPQLLVANEWAGGAYWKPESISTADGIERLRAADPGAFAPERERRALANAGNWPRAFAFAGSWFEDDARVEELLRERIGKPELWMPRLPQAAGVVLSELLERKRDIWSKRLVLMALWAEAAQARPPVPWQELLVNAVHVLQASLTEIPLMPAIAERSVETAWQRYRKRG